jgi:hypothetical protein
MTKTDIQFLFFAAVVLFLGFCGPVLVTIR